MGVEAGCRVGGGGWRFCSFCFHIRLDSHYPVLFFVVCLQFGLPKVTYEDRMHMNPAAHLPLAQPRVEVLQADPVRSRANIRHFAFPHCFRDVGIPAAVFLFFCIDDGGLKHQLSSSLMPP